MQAYLVANEAIFRVPQSLVHGDLYWSNVLVTPGGEAVLIDWLGLSYADYCVDLATFWVGFLRCSPGGMCFGKGAPVEVYYRRLLEIYRQTFNDQTIIERLHFYLPAVYIGDVYALLRGAGGLTEDLHSKVTTYLEEACLAFGLNWSVISKAA
jgi:aminoglycoside phosphotransferase (APT) family kinase protein